MLILVHFISILYSWWDSNPLQWRHYGRDIVSNHHPHDCFLNHLFRRGSKEISKLRVTGLCAGNSPEASEFPAQMASNAEKMHSINDRMVGTVHLYEMHTRSATYFMRNAH